MTVDRDMALFVLLGQSAERVISARPETAAREALCLSDSYDLAILLPESVKRAIAAAEAYKLFFVFEEYMRELMLDVLSKKHTDWWATIPNDVKQDVERLESTEETKRWMAIESRDKSALMTLPQLLKVIDVCWKEGFEDLLGDKSLLSEARLIVHLRNTICHMSIISEEELERIRQVMRDWFRVISP